MSGTMKLKSIGTPMGDVVSSAMVSLSSELAVFDYNEFISKQLYFKQMLAAQIKRVIDKNRNQVRQYETSLQLYSPMSQLQSKKQYVADITTRLSDVFYNILNDRRHKMEIYAEKLNGLSPLNILATFVYCIFK